MLLTPPQLVPNSFESKRNFFLCFFVSFLSFFLFFLSFFFSFFFFSFFLSFYRFPLPRADALHVDVRAWTLCCFHSLINTQTFRMELTASEDSYTEIKSNAPLVVWRKVPETMLGVCVLRHAFQHHDCCLRWSKRLIRNLAGHVDSS